MAFTSQYYYSHYNLSSESPEFSAPATNQYNPGLELWPQEGPDPVYDGVLPALSGMATSLSTPSIYKSINSRMRGSDIGLPEFDMGSNCGVTTGAKLELPEFREECSAFASNLWSDHYESCNSNWEMQSTILTKEPTIKVGKYSVEERKDKILKYLKKRNQRNFNKTIKYACRKTLADKRVRVRGRFAKNNNESSHEGEGDDDNINSNMTRKEGDLIFCNHDFKIKDDDEDWLHTAMANFMYLPYISG